MLGTLDPVVTSIRQPHHESIYLCHQPSVKDLPIVDLSQPGWHQKKVVKSSYHGASEVQSSDTVQNATPFGYVSKPAMVGLSRADVSLALRPGLTPTMKTNVTDPNLTAPGAPYNQDIDQGARFIPPSYRPDQYSADGQKNAPIQSAGVPPPDPNASTASPSTNQEVPNYPTFNFERSVPTVLQEVQPLTANTGGGNLMPPTTSQSIVVTLTDNSHVVANTMVTNNDNRSISAFTTKGQPINLTPADQISSIQVPQIAFPERLQIEDSEHPHGPVDDSGVVPSNSPMTNLELPHPLPIGVIMNAAETPQANIELVAQTLLQGGTSTNEPTPIFGSVPKKFKKPSPTYEEMSARNREALRGLFKSDYSPTLRKLPFTPAEERREYKDFKKRTIKKATGPSSFSRPMEVSPRVFYKLLGDSPKPMDLDVDFNPSNDTVATYSDNAQDDIYHNFTQRTLLPFKNGTYNGKPSPRDDMEFSPTIPLPYTQPEKDTMYSEFQQSVFTPSLLNETWNEMYNPRTGLPEESAHVEQLLYNHWKQGALQGPNPIVSAPKQKLKNKHLAPTEEELKDILALEALFTPELKSSNVASGSGVGGGSSGISGEDFSKIIREVVREDLPVTQKSKGKGKKNRILDYEMYEEQLEEEARKKRIEELRVSIKKQNKTLEFVNTMRDAEQDRLNRQPPQPRATQPQGYDPSEFNINKKKWKPKVGSLLFG